jgi:hypothetical protein
VLLLSAVLASLVDVVIARGLFASNFTTSRVAASQMDHVSLVYLRILRISCARGYLVVFGNAFKSSHFLFSSPSPHFHSCRLPGFHLQQQQHVRASLPIPLALPLTCALRPQPLAAENGGEASQHPGSPRPAAAAAAAATTAMRNLLGPPGKCYCYWIHHGLPAMPHQWPYCLPQKMPGLPDAV